MENLVILILLTGIVIILFMNFTTVESGNYKFVIAGETYIRTIRPSESNKGFFGYYWIGITFLYKVHTFVINKYKVDPNRDTTKPQTWIIHEEGVSLDSLREIVIFPILMENVELSDRTRIDVLLNVIFKFEDPYKFIFELKGNYRTIIAIITSKVIAKINKIADFTEFISLDLSEGSAFLESLLSDDPQSRLSSLNQALLYNSGGIATGLNVSEFNADASIIEAVNKQAIAELNAKARAIEAKAEADFVSKQAVAEIDLLLKRLEATGASPVEQLKALTDLKRSQAIEKTGTTTLVLGGNPGMNINT